MPFLSRAISIAVVCVFLGALSSSKAVNPAMWSISEGTEGEDVFWTSPTAVDADFPRYATSFEITRVEAFAGGIGVDVTGQLGETTGTAVSEALPISLVQGAFTDESSGTSANVDIGIDAAGFGQVAITEVTFGQVVVIFFPVNITRIEVDTDLSIEGLIPGDFDRDLNVGGVDLSIWEASYSANANADTDFNTRSDGIDFLEWQQFAGTDLRPLVEATSAVPEPDALLLVGILMVGRLTRSGYTQRH